MPRQFVPLADAPEHGIPGTPLGLGWVAFHRVYNGAEKFGAIVKFGGRLYVDPARFLEWMATQPRISPPIQRSSNPKVKGASDSALKSRRNNNLRLKAA